MTANIKDNIISILESNKGLFISGEKLANDLNVSRTAIWKASLYSPSRHLTNHLALQSCLIERCNRKSWRLSTRLKITLS